MGSSYNIHTAVIGLALWVALSVGFPASDTHLQRDSRSVGGIPDRCSDNGALSYFTYPQTVNASFPTDCYLCHQDSWHRIGSGLNYDCGVLKCIYLPGGLAVAARFSRLCADADGNCRDENERFPVFFEEYRYENCMCNRFNDFLNVWIKYTCPLGDQVDVRIYSASNVFF